MYFDTRNVFLNREDASIASEPEVLGPRADSIDTHFASYVSGSSILDVACCDGRWSSWALDNGATNVHGFDSKEAFVSNAPALMANYHDSSKYSFETQTWEEFTTTSSFDIVLLFGILHVAGPVGHISLIQKSTTLASTILIDTGINDDVTLESITEAYANLDYTVTVASIEDEGSRLYAVATAN
jgi:2-polyprenyl-3-methyl-5-hydroxy-6-metoxy-1,4-benzoquinol methylase